MDRIRTAFVGLVLLFSLVPGWSTPRLAHASPSRGEWAYAHADRYNSDYQPLAGHIVHPRVVARDVLGAQLDPRSAYVERLRIGGRSLILTLQGGDIIALDSSLHPVWTTPALDVIDVLGAYDLDGSGRSQIVALAQSTLFVVDGATGAVLWRHEFPGDLTHTGVKVGKLVAARSGLQLVVFPQKVGTGFAFAFDRGTERGYGLWITPVVKELAEGYSPEVALGDMRNRGHQDVVIATFGRIIVFDGGTGQTGNAGFPGWKSEVDWISGPGVNGRNYGDLYVLKLDGDPYPDIVMLADGVLEHVEVVLNDSSGLSLGYDRFVGFDYPVKTKQLRCTLNSVGVLRPNGRVQIVLDLYNDRGDHRWHLLIVDALSGFDHPVLDLADTYLWGVQDLQGNGVQDLLVSHETQAAPRTASTLAVYAPGTSDIYQRLWSVSNASFVLDHHIAEGTTRSAYARSQQDEVLVGASGKTVGRTFFVRRGALVIGYSDVRGSIRAGARLPAITVLSIGGADSAGARSLVALSRSGVLESVSSAGGVLASAAVGGLQGVPTVADLDGNGHNEVLIAAYHHVRVYDVGPNDRLKLRWQVRAEGMHGLGDRTHSNGPGPAKAAPAFDIFGDGRKEVLVTDTSGSHPRLRLLDHNGHQIWGHVFPDFPANGQEAGLYSWIAGRFRHASHLDVFVSGERGGWNSEASRFLDGATGKLLWSLDQRDGRGFGPFGGYPALARLQHDGIDDVIFNAKDKLYAVHGASGRVSLLESGNGLYQTPILAHVQHGVPGFLILSDGFGQATVLDGSDKPLWRLPTEGWDLFAHQPGVAIHTGSSSLGLAHDDGVFESRDVQTGKVQWSVPVGSPASDVVTGDIEGNGTLDYLFATHDGRVVLLDSSPGAGQHILWSLALHRVLGTVEAARLGVDSTLSLLVTAGDGTLTIIR